MRKLVVGAFMSLDGVVQAPGGPDEDREGGFEQGGWLVPFFDETFGEIMTAWTLKADAFLLGRKTYEIFAASWPKADPDDDVGRALNTRPKYVASTTLTTLEWNNSTLLDGDVADAVRALKAEGSGEIQVHGSGRLIQTLLRNDLIDTLRLWFFPVVVGSGKRLFEEGAIPRSFRLTETRQTPAGAVLLVCERTGGLRHGEVEVGQETVVFD